MAPKDTKPPAQVTAIGSGGKADTPRVMAENIPWDELKNAVMIGYKEVTLEDGSEGFYPSVWVSRTDIKTLCFLRDSFNLFVDDLLRE